MQKGNLSAEGLQCVRVEGRILLIAGLVDIDVWCTGKPIPQGREGIVKSSQFFQIWQVKNNAWQSGETILL